MVEEFVQYHKWLLKKMYKMSFKNFSLTTEDYWENKCININFVIGCGGYTNKPDIKLAKPFTCRQP